MHNSARLELRCLVVKESTLLKVERKTAGLTQLEVAKKAGISIRAYKTYEQGERIPRADIAILIADAVGSSVEELFRKV